MLRAFTLCLGLWWPITTIAQNDKWPQQIDSIASSVIPTYVDQLHRHAALLNEAAVKSCDPDDTALRLSLQNGMLAWASASALGFGPTEADNRAFALGFWPDPRGKTPKALRKLILDNDPIIDSAKGYTDASIATRGFYALEYMLFDPNFRDIGTAEYRCALIQRQAADIARTVDAIHKGWDSYTDYLINPSETGPYRTQSEVQRELFKGISTALEFTSGARLGRPLGSFDKPRPKRAEARRSGLSLSLVAASLNSPMDLAVALSADDPELSAQLKERFGKIKQMALDLDDPSLSGVSGPASRFRIEALKQQIDELRTMLTEELGPHLGVSAGFNSLDGD